MVAKQTYLVCLAIYMVIALSSVDVSKWVATHTGEP